MLSVFLNRIAVISNLAVGVANGKLPRARIFGEYKREAAIGYVGGIVYSKVLVDKIEKAINLGITGTEGNDW